LKKYLLEKAIIAINRTKTMRKYTISPATTIIILIRNPISLNPRINDINFMKNNKFKMLKKSFIATLAGFDIWVVVKTSKRRKQSPKNRTNESTIFHTFSKCSVIEFSFKSLYS